MKDIPIIPKEYLGEYFKGNGYDYTEPRWWTEKEIEWAKDLQSKGYNPEEIGISLGRTAVSVSIKLKRINKDRRLYNRDHVSEKYELNKLFLEEIKPNEILDLYSGSGYYKDYKVTTNDIDKNTNAEYHEDAFKLICKLYSQNKKYDLIDLDPFGSAFDCFDLAVKMARKGLVITLGELGHKRFKRLDFVNTHYGINSLEEFTIENIIKQIQLIGLRNKKELEVWQYREWKNIGRVYFKIKPLKITSQWGEKENKIPEIKQQALDTLPGQLSLF